jgi:large subunit ribosomal protein L9
MKLILKKDVQSLGESGDIVEVKDGFARNFLLPQAMAEVATKGALENREKNIERIKSKAEKLHKEALDKAASIEKIGTLEIEVKAGENGKLFGAITTRKLAELIIEKTGVEVDRKNISLNTPINLIGEYKMLIKISSKVSINIPVVTKATEIIKELKIEEEVVAKAEREVEEDIEAEQE